VLQHLPNLFDQHIQLEKKASKEEVGMQIVEKSFKVFSNWQGKCKALSAFYNTGNINL